MVIRELLALIVRCIIPVLFTFLYNAAFFFLLGLCMNITLGGLAIITHPFIPGIRFIPPPTYCAAFLIILRILLRTYRQFIPPRHTKTEKQEFAFRLAPIGTDPNETKVSLSSKTFWLNKISFMINLFIDLIIMRFFLLPI